MTRRENAYLDHRPLRWHQHRPRRHHLLGEHRPHRNKQTVLGVYDPVVDQMYKIPSREAHSEPSSIIGEPSHHRGYKLWHPLSP